MTMRNLGLSIYPDHNYDDNVQYLELGHKYSFKRIFMSMLEVQGSVETKENTKDNLNGKQIGIPNVSRCFTTYF